MNYRELQAYLKVAKRLDFFGFTAYADISLRACKEDLQGAYDYLQRTLSDKHKASITTALEQPQVQVTVVPSAASVEVLEAAVNAPESDWVEPTKDYTNADAVYYTGVIPNTSNLSECDVFNRSEGNVEHRVNYNRDCRRGVFSAACTLRVVPVAADLENADEAYSVSYSLNYRIEAVRCTRYTLENWIKEDSQAGVKTNNGNAQVWGTKKK